VELRVQRLERPLNIYVVVGSIKDLATTLAIAIPQFTCQYALVGMEEGIQGHEAEDQSEE
jgi:hypothetical protein